jgi:arylsulfatase A-like enzyme
VDAALDWLGRTGGDRFLWVHLLAPHAPYDPRPGTMRPDRRVHELELRYDAEVRTVDLDVERLLRAVGEDAAVLMTADHGETLDERRELAFDHGKYLFEELVRVPFLLRLPGGRGRIERETVLLADVAPTVCAWFGEQPPVGAYGTSLLEWRDGRPAAIDGSLWERTFHFVVGDDPPKQRDQRWAVRDERWKAVYNVDRDEWELFDLERDLLERTDVREENPDVLADRAARLEEWRRARTMPVIPFDQRFTPEEAERLRAVGYLGGAQ